MIFTYVLGSKHPFFSTTRQLEQRMAFVSHRHLRSHFGVYFENAVSDAYVFATAMGRGKIGMGRGKGGAMGKGKGAGNPEARQARRTNG